jgi:hypothetical protein
MPGNPFGGISLGAVGLCAKRGRACVSSTHGQDHPPPRCFPRPLILRRSSQGPNSMSRMADTVVGGVAVRMLGAPRKA